MRIKEDVFDLGVKGHSWIGYIIPSFSPMRYASTRGLEMNAPSNNNLPTLTNDVIVNLRNPENPDSERQAAALRQG